MTAMPSIALNHQMRKSLVGLVGQWGKEAAHIQDTLRGVLVRRGGPEGPVWWIGPDGRVERLLTNREAESGASC